MTHSQRSCPSACPSLSIVSGTRSPVSLRSELSLRLPSENQTWRMHGNAEIGPREEASCTMVHIHTCTIILCIQAYTGLGLDAYVLNNLHVVYANV